MTFEGQEFEDIQLDEVLRVTRARFIAHTDAGFDFEAGLADVRERAGLPFAGVPARPRGGPGPLAAAVALACDEIEEFVLVLSSGLLAPGAQPDLVGSHLQRAADVLLGLRQQLAAGTASPPVAQAAIANVRDIVRQADLTLRVEVGASLDADNVEAQLRQVGERIAVALSEAGVPPASRPRLAPRSRRREGGQAQGS